MRDFEILDLVDREFRSRYKPLDKLEQIGFKNTKDNVSITYKDGHVTLTHQMKKKETLRLVFDSRRNKKQFENITFEDFEQQYTNGVEIDEIEKKIKETQLPFNEDTKAKDDKTEKNSKKDKNGVGFL